MASVQFCQPGNWIDRFCCHCLPRSCASLKDLCICLFPCAWPHAPRFDLDSDLMAGIHQTQCMFSHTWWNMPVFLGERPIVHTLQTSFLLEECSLVRNHQWWWHQPMVHYQASWDFWHAWSFPSSLNAAGNGWFSWRRKSHRSHYLLWHEMNSLEKGW